MKERRKFVRAGIQSNIKWAKDTDAEKEAKYEDVTKNIGGGGICISTNEKLEKEERLILEIELPNGKTVHSKGRVAWSNKLEIEGAKYGKSYQVGIEFIDISEEDREQVQRLVFEYLHRI